MKFNQNAHITLRPGEGKLKLDLAGKNPVTELKTLGGKKVWLALGVKNAYALLQSLVVISVHDIR